jgi:hypothetical protein
VPWLDGTAPPESNLSRLATDPWREGAKIKMRILEFSRFALSFVVAIPVLASCTTNGGTSPNPLAQSVEHQSGILARKISRGIYVDVQTGTSSSEIVGLRSANGQRPRQFCKVNGIDYADRIAVDGQGRLMAPDSLAYRVLVFNGPSMCATQLASLADPFGQPIDAASNDAATGTIAVANIFDGRGPGSISVCTLAAGCTLNLTNPNMEEVVGVAMAPNGDCWASAVRATTPTLTYFQGCAGAGEAATQYRNTSYGGLDIDAQGDLVSVSYNTYRSKIYVYQGCNPRCSLIGGPFTVKHRTMTAHLNEESSLLLVADYQRAVVDLYRYRPNKLTFQYSFSSGVSGGTISGVAFNPRSEE